MANRESPTAPPGSRSAAAAHLWSYAAGVLLVAAAYYAAAKLGLQLALVERNVTPFWPPTGIAVAAFLMLGRSVWPGVALAAFAVNLPISTGGLAAAATAAGNTLAPLVAATLLARVGLHRQIDRLRDAAALVFVGALLSMSISASVGTGVLAASGLLRPDELPSAWAGWWAGDAMGVLVVTPFVLSLAPPWPRPGRPRWRHLEAAVLFVLTALVSVVAIGADPHLMFLVIPLLGWAAWRFRQRGAAPAALLVVVVAAWAAAKGTGPFDAGTLLEKMLTLQAFNATSPSARSSSPPWSPSGSTPTRSSSGPRPSWRDRSGSGRPSSRRPTASCGTRSPNGRHPVAGSGSARGSSPRPSRSPTSGAGNG